MTVERKWHKKETAPELPIITEEVIKVFNLGETLPPETSVNEQGVEIVPQKSTETIPQKEVKSMVKADGFQLLIASKQKTLENFLGNKENALVFMSSVMHSLEKIPDLRKCDQSSLMTAFMECAALGLYPGNYSGDCYVLPYKGKAQFQLGYRGVKTLAIRAGVTKIWAEIVYKNDEFSEIAGMNPHLEHKKVAFGEDSGEAIGAYACCEITPGNIVFKAMTKTQIMRIKAKSPSKNSEYSPWNEVNDPELWMWKKTCVKQLGKLIPTSNKLDRAIYLDNVSERGGYFENDGKIIETSFVDSDTKIEIGKDKKRQLRIKKK